MAVLYVRKLPTADASFASILACNRLGIAIAAMIKGGRIETPM